MSGYYAMAAQSGMSSMQLALTGENAETKAAYNAAYSATAQRLAAGQAKNMAESNISAITQDKILSDIEIARQQDKAEAQVKLNAATAGVSGQNVDQAVYLTESNESLSRAMNAANAEQQIRQQEQAVANAEINMNNVPDVKPPSALELMLPALAAGVAETASDKTTTAQKSEALDNLWSK